MPRWVWRETQWHPRAGEVQVQQPGEGNPLSQHTCGTQASPAQCHRREGSLLNLSPGLSPKLHPLYVQPLSPKGGVSWSNKEVRAGVAPPAPGQAAAQPCHTGCRSHLHSAQGNCPVARGSCRRNFCMGCAFIHTIFGRQKDITWLDHHHHHLCCSCELDPTCIVL